MVRTWVAVAVAVLVGSAIAQAQFQTTPTLGGIGAPGGGVNTLQYNATGTFGAISNGLTGQCLTYATPPVWGSCAAGSQTSIAAGTNITTSGTAGNVTVNVVATPTFTNLTSTIAAVSGFLTATGVNLWTETIGSINGSTQCVQASSTGVLSGTAAPCATNQTTVSIAAGSNITTSGTASNITVNAIPATGTSDVQYNNGGAFGSITGATSAGSGIAFTTGNLALQGATLFLSGHATTGTIASVTGTLTSGNCLQSDINGNLKDSGSATCGGLAGTTVSIAAGSNITTSGTAGNIAVAVVSNPTFTSLTSTIAAFPGWLTASGVNLQTATIAGNITAPTAQFSGFLTAGGASLSGLTIQTETLSGALNGTTANFSGNLTGTTGQFSGLVTGTTSQFQTLTLGSLGASTQCLESIAGVITGFGSACSSSTPTSIAAGSNITTSGTASNITVNVVATPSFTTMIASANITGATAQFTGNSTGTGTTAAFQNGMLIATPGSATIAPLDGATIGLEDQGTGGPWTFVGVGFGNIGNDVGFGFAKTRGATPNTQKVVGTNDGVAELSAYGSDGVAYQEMASILFQTDGSPVTASMPGAIVFRTTSPSSTSFTNRWSINSAGNFLASTDNSWDIGASGANRPRNMFLAGNATLGGNLTGTTAQFSGTITGTTAQFQTFTGAALTLNSNITGMSTGTLAAGIHTGTPTGAGTLSFFSPSIAGFGLSGTATPSAGWINWGGEARLTTTRTLFNAATLTPTVLSVNLQGGRTYAVDADLYFNTAAGVSGIQASLTGTYGSTATNYFGYVQDGGTAVGTFGTLNPVRGASLSAAKNGVVGNTLVSGTTGYLRISGTVSVSTSGTLVVAAGQNAASTTSTTLTVGSRLIVHDMP